MKMEIVVVFNLKKKKEEAEYPKKKDTRDKLNEAVHEVEFYGYDKEPLPDTTIMGKTERGNFEKVRDEIVKSLRDIASDNDHYLAEVVVVVMADYYVTGFTEDEDWKLRVAESVVKEYLARKSFEDDEFRRRITQLAGCQLD